MTADVPFRMVFYPRDLVMLYGISDRHSRRIVKQIKDWLGREKAQFLFIPEFCEMFNLDEKDMIEDLRVAEKLRKSAGMEKRKRRAENGDRNSGQDRYAGIKFRR
jgi:hypothetical protein